MTFIIPPDDPVISGSEPLLAELKPGSQTEINLVG
jgi:hypothetical protein